VLVGVSALALSFGGCHSEAYIELDVSTNVQCSDVGGTAVTVGVLGQIETRPPVASTDACGQDGSIGTLTILPSVSEDDEVAIKVVMGLHQQGDACTPPAYKGCIVARRVARFVPGRASRLSVEMDIPCKDVPCGELETCSHGRCVPVRCVDGDCEDADASVSDATGDQTVLPEASIDSGNDEDASLADAPPVDASEAAVDAADASADSATEAAGDASDAGTDAAADAADAESGVPDYVYRRPVTLDHTKVGLVGAPATLGSFPVLVTVSAPSMKSAANGGHVQSASGFDIAFRVVGDPVTCGGPADCTLDHEIEAYDPVGGALAAWVRVPALSTRSRAQDSVIYVYYGKAGVAVSPENPAGVWDSRFKGVWHLGESPAGAAPQMRDSTANANHGTTSGNMLAAQRVAGIAAGAMRLDGIDDYVSVPDSASLQFGANVDFTYGAWVKTAQLAVLNQWPCVLCKEDRLSLTRTGIALFVHQSNVDARWFPELSTAGTTYGPKCNDVADGTWHYVVGVRTGANLTGYQDGAFAATLAASAATTIDVGRPLVFGAALSTLPVPLSFVDGTLDEIRVSDVARSADWIATEYSNVSAPATFAVVGAEEAL